MKKGFTLIELLATIAILTIIGLIATTSISKIIQNNKQKLHDAQVKSILEATKLYFLDAEKPDDGNYTCITISNLQEAKLIDEGLIDPLTGNQISNNVPLCMSNTGGRYEYEYDKNIDNMLMVANETNAFWSSVYSKKIKTISFNNNIENIPANCDYSDTSLCWDVSINQNKAIIAYFTVNELNSSYYDLHIVSDKEIYFNFDSSYLFYRMFYVDSIEFNDCINTMFVSNMSDMFDDTGYSSQNFTLDLGDKFDTSNVTNMDSMFAQTGYSSQNFTLDLGDKFDTSNVTSMSCMFNETGENSTVFSLDLGDEFDTANVTNMDAMFSSTGYSSQNFTLDLGDKFDTSNVTNMEDMFVQAGHSSQNFTLDLGDKFDTSNVTNMQDMFTETGYSSQNFTLDLGDKFDTSKVTNMIAMFDHTGYLSQNFTLDLGDKFDTSNVTNMTFMFADTGENGMASLDLGPKFVNIASSNDYMFNFTGTNDCVIYVPNNIYYSNKKLKLNSTSNIYIESLADNRTFVTQ